MADQTVFPIEAGTTDGPAELRVAVQASDGEHVVSARRAIFIQNVAPMFLTEPDIEARVGDAYEYAVAVTDPAGSQDPLQLELTRGPDGALLEDRVLRWTPDIGDVTEETEPVVFAIEVRDDDGETARQTWQLRVSSNAAPTDPELLFPVGDVGLLDNQPRLIVSNATDPDGGELSYFFEIDTSDAFNSTALRSSRGGHPRSRIFLVAGTGSPIHRRLLLAGMGQRRSDSQRTHRR